MSEELNIEDFERTRDILVTFANSVVDLCQAQISLKAERDEAIRMLRGRQGYNHGQFHDIASAPTFEECTVAECREVASLKEEGT